MRRPTILSLSLLSGAALASAAEFNFLPEYFADEDLKKFYTDNCEHNLTKDGATPLFSDIGICDDLKGESVANIKSMVDCDICMQPISARWLSTSKCGHPLHLPCRYNFEDTFGKEKCHLKCNVEGPHEDLNRDSVYKRALELFVKKGWLEVTTEEDFFGDNSIGWAPKDDATQGGYALDFPHVVPPSPIDFLSLRLELHDIYNAAKKAMVSCSLVTETVANPSERLSSLSEELEVFKGGRTKSLEGKQIPLDLLRSFVGAYANRIVTTLEFNLERIEGTASKKWISRLLTLKKIVHAVPCRGIIPARLLTAKFDKLLTSLFFKLYQNVESKTAMETVDRNIESSVGLLSQRAPDTEATQRATFAALTAIRDAIRKMLGYDFSDPLSCERAVPQSEIVALLPYFSVTHEDQGNLRAQLQRLSTFRRGTWTSRLRAFSDGIFKCYEKYLHDKIATGKFRVGAVNWRYNLSVYLQFHDFVAKGFGRPRYERQVQRISEVSHAARDAVDAARFSLADIFRDEYVTSMKLPKRYQILSSPPMDE